jgi:hypothetical protein
MLGSKEFLDKKEELEQKYESYIKEVERYYSERFDQQVERNKILRLNGWALFLEKHKNDYVPNAPDFIRFLINDHYNKPEIENFVLGLFEESNAFLHITPYAIFASTKDRVPNTIKIINSILSTLIFGIIKIFNLESILDSKTKEIIAKGFFASANRLNYYIDKIYSNKKNN